MEEKNFYCNICGTRLNTVDEIGINLCNECKKSRKSQNRNEDFYCWACEKVLKEKSEIAQGFCHKCKESINRKIDTEPVKH